MLTRKECFVLSSRGDGDHDDALDGDVICVAQRLHEERSIFSFSRTAASGVWGYVWGGPPHARSILRDYNESHQQFGALYRRIASNSALTSLFSSAPQPIALMRFPYAVAVISHHYHRRGPHMSLYTQGLNDLVEASRLAAEERKQTDEAERRTLEPVERRLVRLLASTPADEQAQGLSITQLQSQLKARGRGHMHAHIGEIGAALRRLGYVRKRNWRPSEGFVSRWYPPTTIIRSEQS